MPHSNRKTHRRRIPFLLCLILAVLTTTVFAAAAYLYLSGNSVKNTFQAENDPDTSVSDYAVNVGDPGYSVYVRAAVVVNWVRKDSENTVLAEMPKPDADYTLDMNEDPNNNGWFYHNGFWYYPKSVTSGATPVLIDEFTAKTTKDGYELKLELVSQTIQALGTTDADNKPAVTDAWGIPVDSGNLVDPTP